MLNFQRATGYLCNRTRIFSNILILFWYVIGGALRSGDGVSIHLNRNGKSDGTDEALHKVQV